MKILVVSGCDKKQEVFGKIAFRLMEQYCKKHKYDFKKYVGDDFYFTKGLGINTHEMQTEKQSKQELAFNWNKISIVASNLYDYDYVLWIDADAFIVNFDMKLEDVFNLKENKTKEFFIAPDAISLNLGVFLVKNTPNMHTLFRELGYMGYKRNEYYSVDFSSGKLICNFEQSAWTELYNKNWNNLMVLTQIMPATLINSHLQKQFWRMPHCDYLQYEKGKSFILHTAGIQDRVGLFNDFIKGELVGWQY